MNRWRHPAAFTLTELLVVIAVMGILAGLLMPALQKAKTKAHAIVCFGNLRQWGIATQLFVTSHDDYLPKDGTPNGTSRDEGWYVDLPREMGLPAYDEMPWRTNASITPGRSVWICPSNPRRSNGNNLFHYCLNRNVNQSGAGNQVRLSAIPQPSATVWLFDNGKLAAVAGPGNLHTNLHNSGAQVLFLDGHARHFSAAEFWDAENSKGRTNHPALIWSP